MNYRRTIDEIVETLEKAKEGKKCTLLIGAGCSVKAGVPTAPEFVKRIKKDHPQAYRRASEKTYPKCMGELSDVEQRALIAEYVDNAKINWAHVAIAQLMKNGYVDRVLTTNFDLLAVRACALIGLYPAVYDFAASQRYKPAYIPAQAIFNLHGQYTGFVLMNTKEVCERHSERLAPVFEDAGRGRVWIVIGYSGKNDPVFGHLAKVDRFDNGLYWVGYKDNEPAKHVRDELLVNGKDAFYTNGYDADDFLVKVCQQLKCFPPDLIAKPFSHLESQLDKLTRYTLPGQDADIDVTHGTRHAIRLAREATPDLLVTTAQTRLMAGNYGAVIALRSLYDAEATPELAVPLGWGYVLQGNALLEQARQETGAEADRLFAEAVSKYEAALQIKPDKHEALHNWGVALSDQARQKTGAEADRLFAKAVSKYEAALKINPNMYEALYNWSTALLHWANQKMVSDAVALCVEAGSKCRAALEINPDFPGALLNWGVVLMDQARRMTGAEADRLFSEAQSKYKTVLKIDPNMHEALNNLGNTLREQGRGKTGAESDRLFADAGSKYEAALKVRPDKHQAFNNWANALMAQAVQKDEPERSRIFGLAKDKCLAGEEIKRGAGAYNLACIAALTDDEDGCRQWLETSRDAGTLPSRNHIETDSDLDSVRECDWFKQLLETL